MTEFPKEIWAAPECQFGQGVDPIKLAPWTEKYTYEGSRRYVLAEGMSEEEIERVAKAIYEADDPWSEAFPWPNMGSKEQSAENYRRIAKAAIAAMEKNEEPHITAEDLIEAAGLTK